jgi:hypothetical protein
MACSASVVSAMGRVVVVDSGAATVVVVEVEFDGSVVVAAAASVVDVVSGAADDAVLGAGCDAHAPATRTMTIGITIRSFMSA